MEEREIELRLRHFAAKEFSGLAIIDRQVFKCVRCECGGATFRVLIARHPKDHCTPEFMGSIWCTCTFCGTRKVCASCTPLGQEDVVDSREDLICSCGQDTFAAGLMDLFDEAGMYDMGSVVTRCSSCGAMAEVAVFD